MKSKKAAKGSGPAKVDAQFMAVAFATYFTDVDLAGNVFFTDLEHVYRADRDGGVRRWVADVHSHAFFLDEDERLEARNRLEELVSETCD